MGFQGQICAVSRIVQFPVAFSNVAQVGVECALRCARHGMAVFPLIHGRKTPYKTETINQVLGLPDDHPGGFHHATTDAAAIRKMWSDDRAQALVGIATGAKSGIYALDLDMKDGKDGLRAAQAIAGQDWSQEWLWSQTPSGGWHAYFRIPSDGLQTFKSDSDVLGHGIDRRGDGGYVVYYGADLSRPMSAPPAWMLANGGRVAGPHVAREGYNPLGTDVAPSFVDATRALNTQDAAASYEEWRDVLAAFRQAATNTADGAAVELAARLWSMSAPGRYDEAEFDKLWRSLSNGTKLGWNCLRGRALGTGKLPPDVAARWLLGPGVGVGTMPGESVVPVQRGGAFLTGGSPESTIGKPVSSEALKRMRELALPIGFNDFKQAIAVTGPLPWDTARHLSYPRDWTDTDEAALRMALQQFPGMGRIAIDAVLGALKVYVDGRRFNPVVDYLSALRWDGLPRLDGLFVNYFAAKNVEFARLIGAKFLIGMVARAMRPGCQRDEMLILEGEQGLRKSTALKLLAGGDEYFADSLPNMHDKDAKMLLHGNWLIEVGELAGLSKSDVRDVKAFITFKTDKYRPPYGKNVISAPRSSVFAATTNAETYLTDPTGARRFWPVRCGAVDLDGLGRDRDQLFAEAVVRFNAGERWWLDGAAEIALAGAETDERAENDPWHEAVIGYANSVAAMGLPVSMSLVFKMALQLPFSAQDRAKTGRVAAILRKEGFERRQGPRPAREWLYFKIF